MTTITDEQINAALARVVGEVLPPQEIERRYDQFLERTVGTITVAEAAKRWGLKPVAFRMTIARLGIPVVKLGKKIVRIRVADLEKALEKYRIVAPAKNAKRKLGLS